MDWMWGQEKEESRMTPRLGAEQQEVWKCHFQQLKRPRVESASGEDLELEEDV